MKKILLLFLAGFLFTGCFKKTAKNTDLDKVNLKEKVQTAPNKEHQKTELFREVKKDSLESKSTKIDYKIIQKADYEFSLITLLTI